MMEKIKIGEEKFRNLKNSGPKMLHLKKWWKNFITKKMLEKNPVAEKWVEKKYGD